MEKMLCIAFLALAACAGTSASVYGKPAQMTVESAKSPQSFANCVADNFVGANSVRSDGDHYWIVSQFGLSAIIRWDFTSKAGGSVAELRSSPHVGGSGESKVRACA
jgi:hypothetical protein